MKEETTQERKTAQKRNPEPAAETPAPDSGQKLYTKPELEAFIAEIGRKVVDKNPAYLHSMLAVNHLLRQPNLKEVLDEEMKEQLKDIWVKLKTTGITLNDPPVLFGIPENSINYDATSEIVDEEGSAGDGAAK
ncbi:MAG: hypothetical protein U0136_05715 [Bdellovibrionota bacterium]